MDGPFSFCLAISGITIRFVVPGPLALPDNFEPFQCPDTQEPDEEYRLELLTEPLVPDSALVHQEGEARIYKTDRGWLHIYPALGDDRGCQVACLFCPDGRHTLYSPASRWETYDKTCRCGHLICAERFLLRHDAFLLHSSFVGIDGQAVLFCGPSGAGKSTMADLWHTHLGVEVLNGDRTVIQNRSGSFTAAGSMWAGSSQIYRREILPIAGIFLITQAKENRVERLGFDAFVPLFTQTILNSWDPEFMERITTLYAAFLEKVPVYRLHCRPDREAVALAYSTIFGKEPPV
jgi:hypothetical protein